MPMSKSSRAVRAPSDLQEAELVAECAVPAVRPIWKVPSTGAGVGAGAEPGRASSG